MKNNLFFTSLLLLFSFFASGQDSLLTLDDLSFNYDFERTAFQDIHSKRNPNLIDLFLPNYSKDTSFNRTEIHKRFDECFRYLEKETADKADAKKVKFIYEYIHKTFFKVYAEENSFTDIFKDGSYNCVSATAFYAIILTRLNIPFVIKETPTHVYLEAYPLTSKILLESTSAQKGIFKFSDDYIKDFVKALVDNKQISQAELDSSSTTNIFNRHYFTSENISIIGLAGLQYSNYGVYRLNKKETMESLPDFKKALYLNPVEKQRIVLDQVIALIISQHNYENMKLIREFALLCRINNTFAETTQNEGIKQEFGRMLEKQLVDQSDFVTADSAFRLIYESINDSALRTAISFNYHYECSRIGLINLNDTATEFSHLRAAYAINPKNAHLQSFVLNVFGRSIDDNMEPEQLLKFMQSTSKDFSFLNESETFQSIKANCFLELSYRNFTLMNTTAGDNYMKQFEDLYKQIVLKSYNTGFVEKAYSTAAGIYFKKGNYAKSKLYVKTGLIYAPDSFKLRQMLAQY